jgi:hypothetical protein
MCMDLHFEAISSLCATRDFWTTGQPKGVFAIQRGIPVPVEPRLAPEKGARTWDCIQGK